MTDGLDPHIGKITEKFVERSILNKVHHQEQRVKNEVVEIAILGHVALDNSQSI